MKLRVVSLPLPRQRELRRATVFCVDSPLHQPAPLKRCGGTADLRRIDARLARHFSHRAVLQHRQLRDHAPLRNRKGSFFRQQAGEVPVDQFCDENQPQRQIRVAPQLPD